MIPSRRPTPAELADILESERRFIDLIVGEVEARQEQHLVVYDGFGIRHIEWSRSFAARPARRPSDCVWLVPPILPIQLEA